MSLAARVALATTVLLAVAVFMLTALSLIALARSLDERDQDLLTRAVERVLVLDPSEVSQTFGGNGGGSTALLYVALLSESGDVVADNSALAPGSRPILDGSSVTDLGEPTLLPSPVDESGFLAQAIPLTVPFTVETPSGPEQVSTILLAVSRADRDATLDEHRTQLLRTAPAVVALGGVAALVLARAALGPLRRMAGSARRFASGERGRLRSGTSGTARTEVDQVAEALDEAFAARWRAEDQMRDFIADASHELRTPLAAVYGWADLYHELARAGAPSPDAADEVVGHIRREADRMNRLVDEMLALARLESQHVIQGEQVDVAGLVADLVAETAALHPSHHVQPVTPVQGTIIETSSAILGRAVRNLLVNAVVHTPPGTEVRTTVATTRQGGARIEISDSGPGLTPDELSHAGERFWRAAAGRQRGGGSGLGLAIVRESAKSLGGSLTLGASEDGGLRAALELPQSIPSESSAIPRENQVGPGGPRR